MRIRNVEISNTLLASIAIHMIVIGGMLISLATKTVAIPEDSLPVDIISASEFARMTQGIKTAPKTETPKPFVEKVGDAKPNDEPVGKVVDKKPPVETESAPPPQPKVVEKEPEKKPDPPKPEPKDQPKEAKKKPPPPRDDPIKQELKKDEAKKPPVKMGSKAAPPKPRPKRERNFDADKIAALIDKRDPVRNAVTGETVNTNASLGTSRGRDASYSATWKAMFIRQAERCWNKPFGNVDPDYEFGFFIRLRPDGTLESLPTPEKTGSTDGRFLAWQETARRAIIECQPYRLPQESYEAWKSFTPVFVSRAQ